jgi:deoxyribodipyrimidine photolyase-like uncharacterized protein
MLGAILGAGATLGTLAGNLYGASEDRKLQRQLQNEKRQAINAGLQQANSTYDDMLNKLDEYNADRISVYDPSMVQEYKDLMDSYSPDNAAYDFDKFNYDKTVDDFMNPEAEKIAELAGLKTQAQMAGQGGAKGTGALAGMGYSRWEAARDLYKDAQNQMNQDRDQAYKEYGDYIDRMQKKLDTINTSTMNKLNLVGGAIQNEQTAQSDYMSDLLGLMGDKTQTNINATIGAF